MNTNDCYDDDHEITEGDLDEIANAIEEAEDLHYRYAFLSVPKIPCPECGGSGQTYNGSLGTICLGCNGARMLDHPGADKPQLRGFSQERQALVRFLRAQREGLALPPASTLPRPESIRERITEIKEASRQLAAQPQLQGRLQEPKKEAMGLLGDEDAEYTDDEIDACIEEDYGR